MRILALRDYRKRQKVRIVADPRRHNLGGVLIGTTAGLDVQFNPLDPTSFLLPTTLSKMTCPRRPGVIRSSKKYKGVL